RTFRPRGLALEHAADPGAARRRLSEAAPDAEVWVGGGAAATLVRALDADVVVNGIVGAAGLAASLATLERGARLALANKETLVIGAELVADAMSRSGAAVALQRGAGLVLQRGADAVLQRGVAELVPIDSEHSAA